MLPWLAGRLVGTRVLQFWSEIQNALQASNLKGEEWVGTNNQGEGKSTYDRETKSLVIQEGFLKLHICWVVWHIYTLLSV